jgi:hypothetical protein
MAVITIIITAVIVISIFNCLLSVLAEQLFFCDLTPLHHLNYFSFFSKCACEVCGIYVLVTFVFLPSSPVLISFALI